MENTNLQLPDNSEEYKATMERGDDASQVSRAVLEECYRHTLQVHRTVVAMSANWNSAEHVEQQKKYAAAREERSILSAARRDASAQRKPPWCRRWFPYQSPTRKGQN